MINHVWGLIHHPDKEWREINKEHESVSHLYLHHVLWMAAIPVVSTFIGTTQFGWTFGGDLIHWMARNFPDRPPRQECIVFAGYIATPMFLSGIFAIYPIIWLCLLACIVGVAYTGYLLYRGTPSFLGISHKQGFILSSTTLGIGVLVLEALLAAVVLTWSLGSENSIVWKFFQ